MKLSVESNFDGYKHGSGVTALCLIKDPMNNFIAIQKRKRERKGKRKERLLRKGNKKKERMKILNFFSSK